MKSVVIFILLIASLSSTYGASDDCFLIYLNNLNMLEPFFGDIPREYPENMNCQNVIRKSKEDFEVDIFARLTAEDNQNCIIDNINRYGIHNLFLKGKIYYEHQKTAVKNFTKEVLETTHDALKAIKEICTADKVYGMDFDKSLKGRKKLRPTSTNSLMQKCMKKYFFGKNILNAEEFGIDVSTLDDMNCELIFDALDAPSPLPIDPNSLFYGLPTLRSQECINDKMQRDNYILKASSFGVAFYMDLSEELIAKLRERFIQTNVTNTKNLLECLEKVAFVS